MDRTVAPVPALVPPDRSDPNDRVRVRWAVGLLVLAACGSGDSPSTGDSTSSSSSSGGHGSGAAGSSGSGTSSGASSSGASGDDKSGSSGVAGDDGSGDDAASDDGPGGATTADGGKTASKDAGPADATTTGPAKGGCKRGIAANTAPSMALAPSGANPGVSWWYNWAASGSGQAAGIEFDPMIWGSSSLSATLPKGSKYVLGFNEPNFSSPQSNLTPAQAAADWPKVEAAAKAAGASIVSPAVNFCGDCSTSGLTSPYTWLKDFFAACSGCQVDYVAVHWYNCDLPSLEGYIEGNGSGLEGFVQFGKPIWLTEFSCSGSSTAAQNKAYMQAAIPWLEGNAHVYRYSWFSAGPIPNAELVNSDGSLTDLGKTYVSLAEPSCQ
jgi:hypothetical protein